MAEGRLFPKTKAVIAFAWAVMAYAVPGAPLGLQALLASMWLGVFAWAVWLATSDAAGGRPQRPLTDEGG